MFYFLSTIIPWSLWLIAAYISNLSTAETYQSYISILGLLGLGAPMLIATYYIRKDKILVKDTFGRLFNMNRSNWGYFVISAILMPASILLAMGISLLFGHGIEQFVITGQTTFTSGVFPVWVLLILAPILEELAWHSYGTDCLRQRYSLFVTSMIFALYWGIWHLPLALIKDYYHSNLVVEGIQYSLNFLLSIFPFVILMNWLYFKTNRNILVTVVMHMAANVFNEVFSTHPDSKIIQTGILTVLAVCIILKERENFFAKQLEKVPS